MNGLIHVIDDFYPNHLLPDVQRWADGLSIHDQWYELEDMSYGYDMFMAASEFFNLESAIGCEMHVNYHSPKKHHDKDEVLCRTTGKLMFPLCSIVYYSRIQMNGGHLIFPEAEIAVAPKTNRIVFFKGSLLHDGTPFTGTRQSIGINPWASLPLAYRS